MFDNTYVQRLALRYRIGDMTLRELSTAAAELITSGVVSPSLERLAWKAVTNDDEAQRLLSSAADELGIETDVHAEVRSFAREIASQIVSGAVTPYEGARWIWAAARLIPEEHAYDPFIYAASEHEDRPADRRFFDDAIMREAQKLVS